MSIQIVGAAEAAAIKSADSKDPEPSAFGPLLAGETVFTANADDLADLRGRNSRLAEHGLVLKTRKGELAGHAGTYAWAVREEEA